MGNQRRRHEERQEDMFVVARGPDSNGWNQPTRKKRAVEQADHDVHNAMELCCEDQQTSRPPQTLSLKHERETVPDDWEDERETVPDDWEAAENVAEIALPRPKPKA